MNKCINKILKISKLMVIIIISIIIFAFIVGFSFLIFKNPFIFNDIKVIGLLCVMLFFSSFIIVNIVDQINLQNGESIDLKINLYHKIRKLENKNLIYKFKNYYNNFNNIYIQYLNKSILKSYSYDNSFFISLGATLLSISFFLIKIDYSIDNYLIFIILSFAIIIIFDLFIFFKYKPLLLNHDMNQLQIVIDKIDEFEKLDKEEKKKTKNQKAPS